MRCSTIVLVEDDESIRYILRFALESEGYSVSAFCNGKEALSGLDSVCDPCLILLDLMMPVMDGNEFLKRRLAMGDVIVGIPVVIVSATPEIIESKESSETYQGLMRKPVDLDILFRIALKYCGDRKVAA
jgi:CheY-like chemotaxis protein